MTRSRYRFRIKNSATFFFSLLFLTPLLLALPPQDLNESQSPNMSNVKSMMGGPPPGMSMHDKMRGPKATALYPTMINNSKPTQEERQRMEQQAKRWVAEGKEILKKGATSLTTATQRSDINAMREASSLISEGLTKLESGESTYQTLKQGTPPKQNRT